MSDKKNVGLAFIVGAMVCCAQEQYTIPPPPAPIVHETFYEVEIDASLALSPAASKILSAAKVYEGMPYGDAPGQYTCTGLVEQVLRDLGVQMNARRREIIHVATGELTPWEEMTAIDASRGGAAYMLLEAELADPVPLSEAQPGDFVQYWWNEGRRGHSVIIERRTTGEHCFDLYGSHTRKTGVGTWHEKYLGPPNKAFVVRLRPDAIGVEL